MLEIQHEVPPRRALFKIRALQVLELAAGAAERHIRVGDTLAFEERQCEPI